MAPAFLEFKVGTGFVFPDLFLYPLLLGGV